MTRRMPPIVDYRRKALDVFCRLRPVLLPVRVSGYHLSAVGTSLALWRVHNGRARPASGNEKVLLGATGESSGIRQLPKSTTADVTVGDRPAADL